MRDLVRLIVWMVVDLFRIHGGYAAVLLDACMAAAIVASLEPGLSPVTLEYKINFTRPMSANTGVVRGEGKTLHVGRQMAIGEGRLLDAKGILYSRLHRRAASS